MASGGGLLRPSLCPRRVRRTPPAAGSQTALRRAIILFWSLEPHVNDVFEPRGPFDQEAKQ
jgi:hypothetical protein